jgi:hypothetical protein
MEVGLEGKRAAEAVPARGAGRRLIGDHPFDASLLASSNDGTSTWGIGDIIMEAKRKSKSALRRAELEKRRGR